MPSKPLDLDFLSELMAQPEKEPRTNKSKDVRDYDSWFKHAHDIDGRCSNEECVAEVLGVVNQFLVPPRSTGRDRVTATINDHEMCRYCFLDGWHYTPPTSK